MATRYYPAVKVPNAIVRGPRAGGWGFQGGITPAWPADQYVWRLSQSKSDAGARDDYLFRTNQQGNFDLLLFTWQTPPLAAQSISGTIQLCFLAQVQWETALTITDDSDVRHVLHVYIAQGQTRAVRHTLLSMTADTVDFPFFAGEWRSYAVAPTLSPGSALAGDTIIIEHGIRVVASPTPAPTYPPTAMTRVFYGYTGATAAHADAVAGSGDLSRTAWFEFSQTLVEQAGPAAPANETCATAVVLPTTLPATTAAIDTTASTGTEREVWYQWTCPSSLPTGADKVFFHTFGSNYTTRLAIFTGTCGSLSQVGGLIAIESVLMAPHRSLTSLILTPDPSTTYYLRVRNHGSTFNATGSGGILQVSGGWRLPPVAGDLYVAAGVICAYRDGVLVNINPAFAGSAPTGLAIDYTKTPMDDLNGGTHTGERLLVGLHDGDLIEILDLPTLNYGDFQSEIDFIADGFDTEAGVNIHPAQLQVTAAGTLYAAPFGNGYLYVAGEGTLPAVLDSPSNTTARSSIRILSASAGDNQAGGPATPTLLAVPIDRTAPWAFDLNETTGILYYTTATLYDGLHWPDAGSPPSPYYPRTVKRWDTVGNVALPDLITLPIESVTSGPRGLAVRSNGEVLVCHGDTVYRISAAGAILQTYSPATVPEEPDTRNLVDVALDPDGQHIWVIDLDSAHVYQFNLDTGALTLEFETKLFVASTLQLVVYAPGGIEPPEEPPDACPVDLAVDPSSAHGSCSTGVLP